MRGLGYDLEAILNKINNKTKVIFIANPNNPTGTYVSKPELNKFLKKVPKRVIVVLDEAYDVFVDTDDFAYGLEYLNQPNVVVLKTFSKAYGLAGLRMGYGVASSKIISYMNRARPPFNVNSLAQAGAVAALEDKAFIKRVRKATLEGKAYLYQQLSKLGLCYTPSVANFILVDVKKNGYKLCSQMLAKGVIIRDMKQYGLNNFIRVTIGTPSENKRFIATLRKIL